MKKYYRSFFDISGYILIALSVYFSMHLYTNIFLVLTTFLFSIIGFFVFQKFAKRTFTYIPLLSVIAIVYSLNLILAYSLIDTEHSVDTPSLLVLKPAVTLEYASTDMLIRDLKSKKYTDSRIKAEIQENGEQFMITDADYQPKYVQMLLVTAFLFFIFIFFFFLHQRINDVPFTVKKPVNYLIIGLLSVLAYPGMEKMRMTVHIPIEKLSQEGFPKPLHYAVYINENHKNLYVIKKEEDDRL